MFFFVSKLTLALLFRKEMAHSRRDSSKQTTTQPQTDPTVARELRYLIISGIILTLMLAQDINKLCLLPKLPKIHELLDFSKFPDFRNFPTTVPGKSYIFHPCACLCVYFSCSPTLIHPYVSMRTHAHASVTTATHLYPCFLILFWFCTVCTISVGSS